MQISNQDLLWYFNFVSLLDVTSGREKNSLNKDVYLKNDGSKNELFNDGLITGEMFHE